MSKLAASLANVDQALKTLEEFAATASPTRIERAGIIQAFEFTFEVFWKCFKKVADDEGATVASPKSALAFAYAKRWLGSSESDHELWLSMLDDRNLTSHIYREPIAEAVYCAVIDHYCAAFRAAFIRMTSELQKP